MQPAVAITVFFNAARTDFVTVGPITPREVEAEIARLRRVYAKDAVEAIFLSSLLPPGEIK